MKESKYVVIDLGSSYIRGMLAQKNEANKVIPLAFSSVPSNEAIIHGYINNIDSTVSLIRQLLTELEEKLPEGEKISKVYIGFGGQSLESREQKIVKKLDSLSESRVTDIVLKEIDQEIRQTYFKDKEIIYIERPQYLINGRIELDPQGIITDEIEAKYRLIVVKPSVKAHIKEVIEHRLNLSLAGILITPLAEAYVTLSEDELKLGVCYVNIGGGVTTVSIFKYGLLQHMVAIPMGGINVTKDLSSLNLMERDAEELKIKYASITTESMRDKLIEFTPTDNPEFHKTLMYGEVNRIVAARMQEITANFINYMILSLTEEVFDEIIVVLNGSAARLKGYESFLVDIKFLKYASFRVSVLANQTAELPNLSRISTIGMVLLATENCVEKKHNTSSISTFSSEYNYTGIHRNISGEEALEKNQVNQERLEDRNGDFDHTATMPGDFVGEDVVDEVPNKNRQTKSFLSRLLDRCNKIIKPYENEEEIEED